MSTNLVDECYRRARDARRSAELASMPTQKTHFLELERRWLRAAETVTPKKSRDTLVSSAKLSSACGPITRDAPQSLDKPEQKKLLSLSALAEMSEQALSPNLTVTMEYTGLEQVFPMVLATDATTKLILEAEVRGISLGDLLAMLIDAAMRKGLSRALDDEPAAQG
jgi:hypothetical protein